MSPRAKSGGDDLLLPDNTLSADKAVEDISREIQERQDQLMALRREQEQVERRKQELEELNRRRTELATGQKSMREKLARAITQLENAEYETKRSIEEIAITRESFANHLAQINAIDPSRWLPDAVDEELTKSLTKIDHAQSVYNQSRARLDALSGQDLAGDDAGDASEDGEDSLDVPFTELLRRGFALSLPLILFLMVVFFLLFFKD